MAAAALAAGSASAAASSTVSVSGPRSVEAGRKVELHFKGHAAAGVRDLRVWLDNRTCATTARDEAARPELRAPTNFSVRHDFKATLTVAQSSAGTHVVCAYLIHRRTQNTAARASWRYVTH